MFKRSVTFVRRDDADMTEKMSVWGRLHEFADMTWLPYQRKVVYRQDDRVDVATPGDAINDFLASRSRAKLSLVTARLIGIRMKTVEKPLNRFLLLYLDTETKAKAVKSDTKTNANLRII